MGKFCGKCEVRFRNLGGKSETLVGVLDLSSIEVCSELNVTLTSGEENFRGKFNQSGIGEKWLSGDFRPRTRRGWITFETYIAEFEKISTVTNVLESILGRVKVVPVQDLEEKSVSSLIAEL